MPDLATLLADYEREGRCGCAESLLVRAVTGHRYDAETDGDYIAFLTLRERAFAALSTQKEGASATTENP